jgi:hypothetical protein
MPISRLGVLYGRFRGQPPLAAGNIECVPSTAPRSDQEPSDDRFRRLLDYLNRLDKAGVHYVLKHTRPDSVMIDVSLPSWRWEIEFMADGFVDIERYQSVAGVETDPALLDQLLNEVDTGA